MAFKPMNTADGSADFRKLLLYGFAGWGKTTQAIYYKERYGKGFILSGESGLSAIRSAGIDYLPFSSFNGPVDPDKGVYSFTELARIILSDEFKAAGYKWLMLDSLTELSDLVMAWAKDQAAAKAKEQNKRINTFEVYSEYGDKMIGAIKFIRDLPYHVVVTALAKQTQDEATGQTDYWPAVQSNRVQMQIPGLFDCVLCGIRTTDKDQEGKQVVRRFIVTDEIAGWHGKVRDERRILQPVEEEDNIIRLLDRIDGTQGAA